ncbi:unnamed protein product [Psylliodes chrysocephalus]|uniref:Major facilitator superfamily (MFS) profile domain-containing protein n=1 Tax=Psylliodes chrysocephalus TaxID=3402493 RepID=A0A9P0G845_9CUCU|nr:unnamed protein product [Psylliodes chrysocephala]
MEWLGTINLIYTISFLDLFAVGVFFPTFTQHLRDLGASHTTIGLFTASYSAIQVLSGPLIGSWSDIRDRRTVLKCTLLLSFTCYFLLGTTNSIGILFFVRILLAVFKHTQSICKAVISDLIPIQDQSDVLAKSVSIGSCGFIIGPLVGGNLVELSNGFSYVSYFTALLFILNYIIASYIPEDIKTKTSRQQTMMTSDFTVWSTIKREFKKSVTEITEIDWSQHWQSFLLKFLLGVTMSCYFSNQGLYLRETYQLSQKHTGYMISYFSVVSILSGLFLKKIHAVLNFDNIYSKMCFWFGALSLGFICLYCSTNLIVFIILLMPISMCAMAMRVISVEMMFEKSKALHAGSLSGASNSIMSVARFVTPLFTGVTSDIFSEKSVMLIAALPASLGLAVSLFIRQKERRCIKDE